MADLDDAFDEATRIRRAVLAEETYRNLDPEDQRALKAAAATSLAIGLALCQGFWSLLADELRKLAAEEDDESWEHLANTVELKAPGGLEG